eukprot:357017-Rhodomonas_salina.1
MLTPRSFRRVKEEAGSRRRLSDLRVGTRGLSVAQSEGHSQGAARGLSFQSNGSHRSNGHGRARLVRESDSDETLDTDRNALVVVSDTDSDDLFNEIARHDQRLTNQPPDSNLGSESDFDEDPANGTQYLGEGAFEILRELTLSRAENEELRAEIGVLRVDLSRRKLTMDREIQADTHECEHVELLNRARIELEQCQHREAQWERICEKLKWELRSERENVKELRKMMDMIQFGYRLARERGAIPKGVHTPMVPIPHGHPFGDQELRGHHPQTPNSAPPDFRHQRDAPSYGHTATDNLSLSGSDRGMEHHHHHPHGIVPYEKETHASRPLGRDDDAAADELRISTPSTTSLEDEHVPDSDSRFGDRRNSAHSQRSARSQKEDDMSPTAY